MNKLGHKQVIEAAERCGIMVGKQSTDWSKYTLVHIPSRSGILFTGTGRECMQFMAGFQAGLTAYAKDPRNDGEEQEALLP